MYWKTYSYKFKKLKESQSRINTHRYTEAHGKNVENQEEDILNASRGKAHCIKDDRFLSSGGHRQWSCISEVLKGKKLNFTPSKVSLKNEGEVKTNVRYVKNKCVVTKPRR